MTKGKHRASRVPGPGNAGAGRTLSSSTWAPLSFGLTASLALALLVGFQSSAAPDTLNASGAERVSTAKGRASGIGETSTKRAEIIIDPADADYVASNKAATQRREAKRDEDMLQSRVSEDCQQHLYYFYTWVAELSTAHATASAHLHREMEYVLNWACRSDAQQPSCVWLSRVDGQSAQERFLKRAGQANMHVPKATPSATEEFPAAPWPWDVLGLYETFQSFCETSEGQSTALLCRSWRDDERDTESDWWRLPTREAARNSHATIEAVKSRVLSRGEILIEEDFLSKSERTGLRNMFLAMKVSHSNPWVVVGKTAVLSSLGQATSKSASQLHGNQMQFVTHSEINLARMISAFPPAWTTAQEEHRQTLLQTLVKVSHWVGR